MVIQADHEHDLGRMQAGIDALSEGFALFDGDEELVFCNRSLRRVLAGLSGFLEPGTAWSLFLQEARRRHGAGELDRLDAHLSSGIDAPLRLEVRQQAQRWLRLGVHPVDGGGFVFTASDVSEQHRAHQIIEDADDLLRDILDACASRIALCRVSDGTILYCTPAWRHTFGEVSRVPDAFADPVGYPDLLTDLLPTGRVDDRELDMARDDAEAFPARVSARTIDYQGDPAAVVSAEDLSQLHAQRDEIVRINQRLLDAIEALDQGFVLFDTDHRLLLGNRPYLEVNRPIRDVLRPGVSNRRIVERSVATGHEPLAAGWPPSHGETVTARYEFELADRRQFSVSRQATSDGGFVIAWRDITEQKRNEMELLRGREAAFQNEKLNALGQLLAGVAHELNNPLSVVVGHAMMLREEVSDAEALDSIDKISRSAERCAKIVKTFLAMARQRPARLAPVAINELVERALEIAAYGLRKHSVAVELRLADDLPSAFVDEDQMTQVFINLMINAEQALASVARSPRLRVTTFRDAADGLVCARVSDNGPGIEEALRMRIFEPFFTTKAVDEGTGVGLALSHRIVSSHDGRLELDASELGGATFAVSLPASTEAVERESPSARDLGPRIGRALVVEDEPDVAGMFAKLLGSMGIATVVAEDAARGLALVEADADFDFVLCDLRMPGMSGLDLLDIVESRQPELAGRFVFVTGDAISADAESIRRKATHRLLEKPVSSDDLRAVVRRFTQSSRATRVSGGQDTPS